MPAKRGRGHFSRVSGKTAWFVYEKVFCVIYHAFSQFTRCSSTRSLISSATAIAGSESFRCTAKEVEKLSILFQRKRCRRIMSGGEKKKKKSWGESRNCLPAYGSSSG